MAYTFDINSALKGAGTAGTVGSGMMPMPVKKPSAVKVNGIDISTSEGLTQYAKSLGLEVEAKEPKLSFLQRLGRGLSAFEPADAIYKAKYEGKNFATEYVTDILKEAGSALGGKELQATPKKTFKDILVREGMKDREGKLDWSDVVGFAGDVLTDPTTFFGGAMVKSAGKVLKGGAKTVEKVGMAVAPKFTAGATVAIDAAKDALGRAFVPGFSASKRALVEGAEKLAPELKNIAHDALAFKSEQDFAKAFTKEELGGMEPVKFFNTYTKPQPLSDQYYKALNQKAAMQTEVGTKTAEMFKDLPKDVQDDLFDGLFKVKTDVLQRREYEIGERTNRITSGIKNDVRGINRNLNQLKYNYRANSKVVDEIERLQSKLADNQGEIYSDLGKYLSDTVDEATLKTRPMNTGKIPPALLGDAAVARRYKTFDDFMMSPDARALDKRVLSGEFEQLGYKGDVEESLAKFYDDATGASIKPAKTTLVEPKKVTAEDLAKKQKEVFKATEDLATKKEIDLESTLDAVRMNEKAIDDLIAKKAIHQTALKNVFEDTTKSILKRFNEVPLDSFKTNEARNFYINTLAPYLMKEKKMVAEIANMQEDLLMSGYIPSIRKETISNFNSAKRLVVGSEDRLKRARGLAKKEDIITDPAEAYARAAAEVRGDGMTKEFLVKLVHDYGRPLGDFRDSDEALKAGYRMMKEKGMFGKEIGWMKDNDVKMINETFDPSFKVLNNLAKSLGYDWLTGVFKFSTTGLFPNFHVRNLVSGELQNFEVLGASSLMPWYNKGWADLTQTILSKKPDYKKIESLAKEFDTTAEELVKTFRDKFGVSSQYISDFGIETQKKLTQDTSFKGLAKRGNVIEMTRNVGNFIETSQKAKAMLVALRKGHNLDEALNLAERAGFDYSKLTSFEKNVMRRLLPFYSYTRKNLELQIKTLAEHPERLGQLTKVFRSAGAPQTATDGEVAMPEWMKKQFTIISPFGESKAGLPQVMSGFGTPVEEFTANLQDGPLALLIKLNPIIKVPLERATGKDFFRQQDIKDVYSAKEYSDAPSFVKKWLKVVESEKDVYKGGEKTGAKQKIYRADPERLHIARNLFTARGVNYLDTFFGENELSTGMRALKGMTGVRPYELDEDTINYFKERDNIRDLTDYLKSLNVLKTYQSSYVSKQMKKDMPELTQY